MERRATQRAQHERAGMGCKFDGAARAGLLLEDGRGLHVFSRNALQNNLGSPQQQFGANGCTRVMQGRADRWLGFNGAVLLPTGGFAASLGLSWAHLQSGISVCVYAEASGEGAPCFQWGWRLEGTLGPRGGGWAGGWWGRRRRRQALEEGWDVSGKSWVGSMMA